MTCIVAEPSHELPMVGFSLMFRAGAVHEPGDRAGLARMVVRMLRRGTPGRTAEQIDEQLDALGAELGVAVGLGTTTVHVEVLRRSLDAVVDLVAELLGSPSFPEDELERLKRQTEAEIVESRDNDGFLAGRALRRRLFAGHPHGGRVGGQISTVRSIARSDLEDYHRRYYARDNAIVGIWGDVPSREVHSLVDRVLRALPQGEVASYPVAEHAMEPGRRLVVVDKPERQQTQLLVGTLGTHPRDDDHIALLVANTALGGTFTSRLMQEIRVKRGWSYGASSQLSAGRIREMFSMWSAPSSADAPDCLALKLDLLETWCAEGVTARELEFCKSYMRRSYAFDVDTARKRVGQGIERELLGLPDDFHATFVERVDAVDLDGANAAVRRRIDPASLWVAVVGQAAELEPRLRTAAPTLSEVLVDPYDLE